MTYLGFSNMTYQRDKEGMPILGPAVHPAQSDLYQPSKTYKMDPVHITAIPPDAGASAQQTGNLLPWILAAVAGAVAFSQ